MANPTEVCNDCKTLVDTVFDAGTGTRQQEIIAGDLFVGEQCFVRDEIRFLNNGRLIFVPLRGEKEYFREYFVICRKLVVVGGKKPGTFDPCGPDDPGTTYKANNVITWQDRLSSAASGSPLQPPAGDGVSHDPQSWSDQGQGNNGSHGGNGSNGNTGPTGRNGLNAPKFTIVALEVEIGLGDHLTIDFDGQNGGQGGRGQNGGDGGTGMKGRIGKSDTTWPGTGCDRQPGNGGNGGDGGDGGTGGLGGNGGAAAAMTVISTIANIAGGPFVSGNMSFINDGGSPGVGGLGGVGGRKGQGAGPGFPTSECSVATAGSDGQEGLPIGLPNGPGSNQNQGPTGGHGAGETTDFTEITRDTCLDQIPLPVAVNSIIPNSLCRGFSTPESIDVEITGQNLSQVIAVTTPLAGVTISILPASTDVSLKLRFDIAGNSATGAGNLVFERAFGPDHVENNAITVNRFEVLTITPNTGARNNQVAVTITGTCFDLGAALQSISVSGFGVTVLNPIFTDAQTAQCVFDIGGLAQQNVRSITVQTGLKTHTLLNAFTVT